MPAPLRERSREDGRELAPPVFSQMERTWPDHKSPRLSAPGSRAGSRTTLNASSFPSIPPLQKSSAFLRLRAHRRQPSMPRCPGPVRRSSGCTDPRRCGSGARAFGSGRRSEPVDPHSAAHKYWREMLCRKQVDSRPLSERDSRAAVEVGRSSNGRTMPFGGICPGSNPGRPAKFF
jgi:hypothetical protein